MARNSKVEIKISAHLMSLEGAGLVKIGTGKLSKDFWSMPRTKDPKRLALKSLLKEREEGR